MTLMDRLVAGDGKIAMTFDEWISFTHAVEHEGRRSHFIDAQAAQLGMTTEALLAAADRTTVYVEAKVWRPNEIEILGYVYEIQDAPA